MDTQLIERTVGQNAPSVSTPRPTSEHPLAKGPGAPTLESVARAQPQPDGPARQPAAPANRRASAARRLAARWLLACVKRLATVAIALVAVVTALVTWDYYVTAPWTRDGRVRVQVASVAPQVSGQITELRVGDNQYVHKGDVLYVIDPFDFRGGAARSEGSGAAAGGRSAGQGGAIRAAATPLKPCDDRGGTADLRRRLGPGEGEP